MSEQVRTDQDQKSPKIGVPRSRYLVYTSAGDRSAIDRWLKGEKNFDLWVTHYGEGNAELRKRADFYNQRRGGKFPNLHHVWQVWHDLLCCYDAIFALDDDIQISGSEISHLFRIHTRYGLMLLQPAFSRVGKISHPITICRALSFGRYTNFVENNATMFGQSALEQFMDVYDPKIIGWGTDWWYLHVLRHQVEGRVAVIDAVSCVNPDERLEKRARAIDNLQSTRERRQLWEQTAKELGIEMPAGGVRTLGSVRPTVAEDRLAVALAPLRRLKLFLLCPHYFMRAKRLYWRLYWRARGSRHAW
jgi:hypothetical protein